MSFDPSDCPEGQCVYVRDVRYGGWTCKHCGQSPSIKSPEPEEPEPREASDHEIYIAERIYESELFKDPTQ